MAGQRLHDGNGGFASHVSFSSPSNVAIHPESGDLFIADTNNHVIRRVDKMNGVITTVAGTPGVGGYAGDGKRPTDALLYNPTCVTFTRDGQSMYIVDSWNHRVRMVRDGLINTVAGSGIPGYERDGGQARSTLLNRPSSATVLPNGELIIADTANHRIRKVDLNGIISTIAGTGMRTEGEKELKDDGLATSATLNYPEGIVVNENGDIFFADRGNYRIRRIDLDGKITTVVGTGTFGATGDNGPADKAMIGEIKGLASIVLEMYIWSIN